MGRSYFTPMVVVGFVIGLLGCGGPPSVDTVKVTGTVTRGGKPLEPKTGGNLKPEEIGMGMVEYDGYMVQFVPVDGVGSYIGYVTAGGKYEVDLPTGKYKVSVMPHRQSEMGMMAPGEGGAGEAQSGPLKTLEVEITGDQELNIEI